MPLTQPALLKAADMCKEQSIDVRLFRLSAFFSIVIIFVLFQSASNRDSLFGFSYWIIPDSVTNFELTRGLVTGEFALSDFLAAAGVPLYYAVFFDLGIVGFIIANAILLAQGVRYFRLLALYVPLLLYPHYLQLLVLPSKDMMVLAIYFVAIYLMMKGDLLKATFIALAIFFIRDGATFVLLPMVMVAILIQKTNMRPIWIVIFTFLCGIAVSLVLEEVAGTLFVVSRNLYALSEQSSDAVRNLPMGIAYLARVFFNLTNMAFRLPFVDNFGGISIASVFMYISGISSLVCCILSAKSVMRSTEKKIQIISVCYFVSLFVISLNPFIQGRYQLPMAIVASVILFRSETLGHLARLYSIVIAISLVARITYGYMNIPFPLLEANPVDLLRLVGG